MVAVPVCALLAGAHGPAEAGGLSNADRRTIGQLLGSGVLGEAVDAAPLSPELAPLREGTWTYRIVSGEKAGQTEAHVLSRLDRDPSGASWRYQAGPDDVLFLQVADDGLSLLSEQDTDEGVIVRYAPAQPLLIDGLAPGGTRQLAVDVKVYDLSEPNHLEHTGKLQLTYSYLGAYRVSVPAGSYSAALIKWSYQGKVWLADVADTQYRLVAPEVGLVASVDKEDISALLVYEDHSKTGLVLLEGP